ncbi:MAG: Spy/CpxP family protein refolding chaperone [Pseudomonadota bacterium]
MKRILPFLTAASLLAGVAPALSQQPPAPPVAAGVTSNYTEADAGAVLNARLAALKAVMGLTPEQDKLWAPLETAIRDISKSAAQRRQAREAFHPKTFLDVLEVAAKDDEARAKDLQRFVTAAKPLVAALTPEQVRRIPPFLGLTERGQPSTQIWIFEEEE